MAYRWKAKSVTPTDYVFLNAALTTAMGWPAEADAKLNIHYGYSFEQFTGLLVVTGGGAGTYPHAADVWHDTGTFGPTGVEYTPAMKGSDITNCTAGNIKHHVVIDDVTGNYSGTTAPGSPETVVAGHTLSLPMQRLKTLLLATTIWQGIVDEADDHIRFCEVGEHEDVALRPWALIDQGSQWEADLSATGTAHEFLSSGSLMLRFVFNVAAGDADNSGDAQMSITNTIGEIIEQMIALAGSGGYLMINSIKLAELGRTAPENRASEGDFVSMMFEIGWGL
jgi:hypothetical protein